jgi:serine/threonine protein kinase
MSELAALGYGELIPLGGGAYADVYAAKSKPIVLKIARETPRSSLNVTNGIYFAEGRAFHTGSVGAWRPDPKQILAAEAKLLRAIDHPAFPKLIEEKSPTVLVMSRLPGKTWREAMREREIGIAEIQALVRALIEVRKQLPFHGDLKPENLLLAEPRRIGIIDPSSGMAELVGREVRRLLVSEWYNPALEASDLPAIGLIAIEALSGRQALVAADESQPKKTLGPKLAAWLEGGTIVGGSALTRRYAHLLTPRELDPKISPALEAIALRCLSLSWDGKRLERAEPYPGLEALEKDLRGLRA